MDKRRRRREKEREKKMTKRSYDWLEKEATFSLETEPNIDTSSVIVPSFKRRRIVDDDEKAPWRVLEGRDTIFVSRADAQMVSNSIKALKPLFTDVRDRCNQASFPTPTGVDLCAQDDVVSGFPRPSTGNIRRDELDYHKPVALHPDDVRCVVEAARYLRRTVEHPTAQLHATRIISLLCFGNASKPEFISSSSSSSIFWLPVILDPTYAECFYVSGSFMIDKKQPVF
jgi:hypothetical protein